MDFTVIIPSRNRPQLVRQAIRSVLAQTHPAVEVIVVDDGSSVEAGGYTNLAAEFDAQVRVIDLQPLPNGHGSSYGYNRGVDAASGTYICMLDDDDYWTDPQHLARAWQCLAAGGAEVYFANQTAFRGDLLLPGPIWLEPIEAILKQRGARATGAAYVVTVDDLAQCGNFCHFNTTILSRELYQRLRGMNEFIRYENDRDFYLRIIDQAGEMLYFPGFVARHNAPDPARVANASTSLAYLQKMLYRTYIFDKARIGSQSSVLRDLATLHQSYTLRRIAEELFQQGHVRDAYNLALEALCTRFSFKWTLYCLYLGSRASFKRKASGAVGSH